jgi:hypothetical protein
MRPVQSCLCWALFLCMLFLTGRDVLAHGSAGLVGFWKFEETGGTTAYDSSGNGNNGTLMNGVLRAAGRVGRGLDFDGTDDYVGIAVNAALNNPTALTNSAWIYPRRDSHWHVVDKGDGDKRLYAVGVARTLEGRVRYTPTHAVSESADSTVTLNAWQHVTMTWSISDNTSRLYINGAEVSYLSKAIGSGAITDDSDYPYTIGARGALGAVTFFSGIIDEVRVYHRVLTVQEIAALYNAGTATAVCPFHRPTSQTAAYLPGSGQSEGIELFNAAGSFIRMFSGISAYENWRALKPANGIYFIRLRGDQKAGLVKGPLMVK